MEWVEVDHQFFWRNRRDFPVPDKRGNGRGTIFCYLCGCALLEQPLGPAPSSYEPAIRPAPCAVCRDKIDSIRCPSCDAALGQGCARETVCGQCIIVLGSLPPFRITTKEELYEKWADLAVEDAIWQVELEARMEEHLAEFPEDRYDFSDR